MHVSNANRVRVGRRLAAACLSLGMIASLAACAGAGPQTAPPLEVTATRTLSVVVSSSGDDAENRADGTITFISPDLELGLKRGQPQTVGLRFTGVQLPRGAKIRRAYVQFTADEAHSAPARVTIRAEATGSAKPFRAAHHNLAYRAKTRARVVWTPLPWTRAGEAGAAQRTPDLAAVLQEVVDRPDWRSGGSVALLFQGHSGLRVARAFDRHPNAAPRLVIELGGGSQSVAARGVPVIFDTDLGIDVDDAGALAVLHALADRGEARLLATIANVNDPYAAAALGAINTFYGRPDVPVGRNPRPQYAVATPYWRTFAPRFVKDLAERFPHNTAPNPEAAVAVYRRVLAAQPDSSVTLIAVGFLQNLADLLASSPDRYSGLSGEALVRRKVRQLVVMAGTHPGSSRDLYLRGGREMTPEPAMRVLETWPTPVVFTPGSVCGGFVTGHTLARSTPPENPVRAAYTLFFGREGVGRNSWDLCTVLYAVRGTVHPEGGTYFGLADHEALHLSPDGVSAWRAPGNGRHRRLYRVIAQTELQRQLEALLTAPPRGR